MSRLPLTIVIVISAILFSGCIQQIAISSLGTIMDNGFEVLNAEEDLEIADKSIASNLKLLEAIIKSDPDNEHFLFLASQGYASYTLGFVEDVSPERARVLYLRGRDYGFQILSHRNKNFAAALDHDVAQFQAILSKFDKDDVPAVFWTAIGWGSYISLSFTEPTALADLPKVQAMMQFVLEHDSTYFYGGAHFFLATVQGTQPKVLGGNPDASRDHFERCLKINEGKFLMTYVYYARSYAVQIQDKELFEELLTKVDEASLDILPEARLSNAIAKKKAALLRSQIDEMF